MDWVASLSAVFSSSFMTQVYFHSRLSGEYIQSDSLIDELLEITSSFQG